MEARNYGHLFQCCKKVRSVWDILGSDLGSPSFSLCRDFRPGVMCQICAELNDDFMVLLVTVAWSLWTNRIEIWNGGSRKQASHLVQWSKDYLLPPECSTASVRG